jgi:hypothetical protein
VCVRASFLATCQVDLIFFFTCPKAQVTCPNKKSL